MALIFSPAVHVAYMVAISQLYHNKYRLKPSILDTVYVQIFEGRKFHCFCG